MRGMPEPVEVILLRQWASYMDYPVWIMNAGGDLIYFNEKAAPLIGQSYEQVGDIAVADIAALFETTDLDGSPLPTGGPIPLAGDGLEHQVRVVLGP